MSNEFDFLLHKVEEVGAKTEKKKTEILAAENLIVKLENEQKKYKKEFLNKTQRLHQINQERHDNMRRACAAEVNSSNYSEEIDKFESDTENQQLAAVSFENDLHEKIRFGRLARYVISAHKFRGKEYINNRPIPKGFMVQNELLAKKKKDESVTKQINTLVESIAKESLKADNFKAKLQSIKNQVHQANSELLMSRRNYDVKVSTYQKRKSGKFSKTKNKNLLRKEIENLQASCTGMVKDIRHFRLLD